VNGPCCLNVTTTVDDKGNQRSSDTNTEEDTTTSVPLTIGHGLCTGKDPIRQKCVRCKFRL